MKLSSQIMKLMADGEQWSIHRLCVATGASKVKVQQTVANIIAGGYAISTPVVYQLTPVGTKKLEQEPANAEVIRERARVRIAMKRKRDKERLALQERIHAVTIGAAMTSRPALDMAWMRAPELSGGERGGVAA